MPRRFSPLEGAALRVVAMVAIACSSCAATANRDQLTTIPEPLPPFVAALSQPAPPPDVAGAGDVVRAAEEPKPVATAAETDAKTPEAAALIEVRDQLQALRRHFEATSDVLRSEVEQLKADQLKLRAQIERAPRGAAMAPVRLAPAAVGSTEPSSGATAAPPTARRSADVAGGTTPPKREPALAPTVIVSGSVRNPGVYSVAGVKTLGGAIQAAGKRDDANVGAVEVRSANQESALLGIALGMGAPPSKTVVDLSAIASGKTADLPLRGGEVIFVPASGR